MKQSDFYADRRQTEVKHAILKRYLQGFARIVGTKWKGLTYVDCFSGPWEAKSAAFEDTSFGIAVNELRSARDYVRDKLSRDLELHLYFLEKDKDAFRVLERFCSQISDIDVLPANNELESEISGIVNFVRSAADCFPFVFLDPKGWTGFGMREITPILQLKPVEVLVNFQSDFINRFLSMDSEGHRISFERLFGVVDFKDRLGFHKASLSDRWPDVPQEELAVRVYADRLREVGGFDHVARATVLHEGADRVYFNMVYATRNPMGVKAFKDAERFAMKILDRARQESKTKRHQDPNQMTLLDSASDEFRSYDFLDELRARYVQEAQHVVLSRLRSRKAIRYDDAYCAAMSYPLVWEGDFKRWLTSWRVSVLGLGGRESSPKLGKNHILKLEM